MRGQVTEEVKEQGIGNKEERREREGRWSFWREEERGPLPEQLGGTILLVSSTRTVHCREVLGMRWLS